MGRLSPVRLSRKLRRPRRLEIVVDMPAAILAKQACQYNYITRCSWLDVDRKPFFYTSELHVLAVRSELRVRRPLRIKQDHVKKVSIFRQADRLCVTNLDLFAARHKCEAGHNRQQLSRA